MKSIIKADTPVPDEYPYLGIYREGTFVVLFTAKRTGTVVFRENDGLTWKLGHHDHEWVETSFKRFHGQIILEN